MRALVAVPSCTEVVMVNRKATALGASGRLRQVVLDTGAAGFQAEVTKLALRMVSLGDPIYAASCVGVGKGSAKWTEEELKALELGVVGGFARGCHDAGIERFALLSAVGSNSKSMIRYARIMGQKEKTVVAIGFTRLAIFRPGIIGGNKHTVHTVNPICSREPARKARNQILRSACRVEANEQGREIHVEIGNQEEVAISGQGKTESAGSKSWNCARTAAIRLRVARSGGEARQLEVWQLWRRVRASVRAAVPAGPWQATDGFWIRDSTPGRTSHAGRVKPR